VVGRAGIIVPENEPRALSLGYDVNRYKLVAFVISAGLAGLAGSLKAIVLQFASLSDVHWHRSGEVVLMTLLGGMGTVVGPVLGAAALLLLEEFLPQALDAVRPGWGEHWQIVLGPLLLAVVLGARQGLLGLLPAARSPARPAAGTEPAGR